MPPSAEAMYEIAIDMIQDPPQSGPVVAGLNEVLTCGGVYAALGLAMTWAEVIRQTGGPSQRPVMLQLGPALILSPDAPDWRIRLAAAQFVDAWCARRYERVTLIAISALGLTVDDTCATPATEFLTTIHQMAYASWQHHAPRARGSASRRRRRRQRRHR